MVPLPYTGGHAAIGEQAWVVPYAGARLMKMLDRAIDDHPGDAIRIVGIWREPAPTGDYGRISRSAQWTGSDGTGGGIEGQLVLTSLTEPATLLPIASHNNSSTDWGRKPYVTFSPDETKLFFNSDQQWPALDHFRVYTQRGNGTVQPANECVLAMTRTRRVHDVGLRPGTRYGYLVQAIDSRDQVLAEGRGSVTTSVLDRVLAAQEAEDAQFQTPVKPASEDGVRYLRTAPGEDGEVAFTVDVLRDGRYLIWVRHRLRQSPSDIAININGTGRIPVALHRWIIPGRRVEHLQQTPDQRIGTRWNEDPVSLQSGPGAPAANLISLRPGRNTIALSWSGAANQSTGRISWLEVDWLTVTNDHAWRPPGWNPRIDFMPEPPAGGN